MQRVITRTLVFILLLLLVLFMCYFLFKKTPNRAPVVKKGVAVHTLSVTPTTWPKRLQAMGTFRARQGVVVRADVEGRVTKVFVQSSQAVVSGQSLYQINPRGLADQANKEKANTVYLKAHYMELKALFKKGYISNDKYRQAKANYQQALSSYKDTERQLALTTVRAPFSGRLGLKLAHLGDFLQAGAPVIKITHPDSYRIDFSMPAAYHQVLKNGKTVSFVSSAVKGVIKASIYALDNSITDATHLLAVRAHVTDMPSTVKPGTIGLVTFDYDKDRKAILVPQSALVYTVTSPTVFLISNHHAKQIPVTIGEIRGNQVAVLKGLVKGDVIAAEGAFKLTTGALVR